MNRKYVWFSVSLGVFTFLFAMFCFVVAVIGKPVCLFHGLICFVRPWWW